MTENEFLEEMFILLNTIPDEEWLALLEEKRKEIE